MRRICKLVIRIVFVYSAAYLAGKHCSAVEAPNPGDGIEDGFSTVIIEKDFNILLDCNQKLSMVI